MIFCTEDDNDTSVVDESFVQRLSLGRGRRSMFDYINFTYKRVRIKMVETFVYLRALFHWKQTAESAWTAFKAFGCLACYLCMVPFCRSFASKWWYTR